MLSRAFQPLAAIGLFVALNASAGVIHYVNLNNPGPVSPFISWATAATSIQDAIDVADLGDTVLVTNGIYKIGGRVVSPYALTNRIVVNKAITVQSVNGPASTVIQGSPVVGNTAVRCVYLANNAQLVGFTLTKGATLNTGDFFNEQSGGGVWAATTNAMISNCVLISNSAIAAAGGVYLASLVNSLVASNSVGNSPFGGGGAYQSVLNNCLLIKNSAYNGGGANGGSLSNCAVTGNSANDKGGGVYKSLLMNCTVSSNSAPNGGGAETSTLNNCALNGNSATMSGGGADFSTLNNCTIAYNSAGSSGGGAFGGTLDNCIAYFNLGPTGSNYSGSILNYCCTTPLPSGGTNNLALDPQLVDLSHISATSPCRGSGSPAYSTGVDIDGEAWLMPPSIGCDEFYSVNGPLSVIVQAGSTNPSKLADVNFDAQITGRCNALNWDFGDGTMVTNSLNPSHAWKSAGVYSVVLTAYNDSNPGGVSATIIMHVSSIILYVDVNSTNPASPFLAWATAATNIQDAIDLSSAGDQIFVTNGLYRVGSRITDDGTTNRVVVSNAVTIQSINGPSVTCIDGGNVMRCLYLANGVVFTGFTLTNGNAANGGGVFCASTNAQLFNCVIVNNSATQQGAGASSGTLSNCTISGNSIAFGGSGGGACNAVLNNCTLTGNTNSGSGAGAYNCTLNFCSLTGNVCNGTGSTVGGGAANSTLNNCTLTGNQALGAGAVGGGANGSTLNNCTLTGNYSGDGGGVNSCNLTNCLLSQNGAGYGGGGACGGTLVNCTLSDNSAGFGGGAYYQTALFNCTLVGNYASYGGGANDCGLYNCVLSGNTAGGYGGGGYGCTLNNCTISGNTAQSFGAYGGGAYGCTLNNSIIYYNTGGAGAQDMYAGTLNYCCTPTATGAGNITNAPLFVTGANFHLQSGSPCINSGNNLYAVGNKDLDGNLRIAGGTVDMGAYEYQTGNLLTVGMQASLTNVPLGYPVSLTGIFSKGQSDSWDFGDGTTVSNQLTVSHTWTIAGDYSVVLTVYDTSAPGGVNATTTVHVMNQMVYYVNLASTNPVAPYGSWSTAATNIQDAIDVALPVPQSLVLVTNGVYHSGGRVAFGSLTNRVLINKTLMVQSVNGPSVTVIQGNPAVGDTAVRCVYLTNNAILSGFSLTAGATRSAGDAVHENSGGAIWCESTSAIVSNCVLIANSAVAEGGGIYGGTIVNSTVCSNRSAFSAGSGNGGGASFSILNGCALFDNIAGSAGGGANSSTLNACSLTANQTGGSGGGVNLSTLNNCTLTANISATGGGANSCTMNNCIACYNVAVNGSNYSGTTLNYCCTQPLPGSGQGNTAAEPRLTDSAHISADSPCRGMGSTNYVSGTDIDGQSWINPPSIGCDEFYSGACLGALNANAQLSYSNVAAGFSVNCTGIIFGHATSNVWNFGDGTSVVDQIAVSHAWTSNGAYTVLLTAYNTSNPEGVSVTNIVHVMIQPVHYVSLGSLNPMSPYLSWDTAATNIQDAVDAAFSGATVLVTNGVYQTGGRIVYGSLSNRLVINKPITVQSANGPAVTSIQGYSVPGIIYGDDAVRCVYMTNDTVLSGFTIQSGATRAAGDNVLEQSGGGVFCEPGSALVSNCVLTANSAYYSAGGAYQGSYNNCILSSNVALDNGGGVLGATLVGCTLSNNSATHNLGGGAESSILTNCLLIGNSAYGGGGAINCSLYECSFASNYAGYGAGASSALLDRCILSNNSASQWGGGALSSRLIDCLLITNSAGSLGGGAEACSMFNCTVIGNSSGNEGGGVSYSSPVYHCIIYSNTAVSDGANSAGGGLAYCCTTPDPGGVGNITNVPLFVNQGIGNFHLQSNSPCINAGNNTYSAVDSYGNPIPWGTDLDGNPRIAGGTVDIGAYEFQNPASIISYAWLQQYGFATDGSADFLDPDHDGMSNWQEWIAGTDPTNPLSVLHMLSPTNSGANVIVTWQSTTNESYYLLRATNLNAQPVFQPLATNLVGQAGTTSYTDTHAAGPGPFFYRVGVQ